MSHLSKHLALIFVASLCMLFYAPVIGQDNTPPQITVPAQNISVSCNSTNIIGNLTNWYNNNASAMATDNSGSVSFIAQPSLSETIDIFNASSDTLCGDTRGVFVQFIAVDPSGNQSIPSTAKFSTFDNVNPLIINKPPDVTVSCTSNVRDSLITWIQSHGHANASDVCSDTVYWTTYVSNLPPLGSISIENGPYPNLPTNRCDVSINVTFFVQDDCGNTAATTGTFRIMDDEGPIFDTLPPNVTISCDQLLEAPTVSAFDDCYGEVFVTYTEETNQNADSTLCEHYNYELLRIWTAEDLCGNSSVHRQEIAVRDLSGPTIEVQNPLIVDCDDILINNVYNNIENVFDDCTDSLLITFVDNGVISGCQFSLIRVYSVEDICGNVTNEVQTLLIRDTIAPTITEPAHDSIFLCDVDMDYNAAFTNWVANRGGSKSTDQCSNITIFAAVPGSYDIENSSTFPGQNPDTFDISPCPSVIAGFLRYEVVDFLHIDECQNVSVTSAIFGIKDDSSPMITSCPSDMTVSLEQNECAIDIQEVFPTASDNCTATSSPIKRRVVSNIVSSDPGNPEIIVDTVIVQIGPFNTSTFDAIAPPEFVFDMQNIDADDPTEFFTIFNEDGINIGQTPLTMQQCGDTTFTVSNQSLADLSRWLSDGFITFTFAPNEPASSGVLGINAVCNGSRIGAEAIITINPINILTTSYQVNNESEIQSNIGDTININVSVGPNTVDYIFEDCAGNTSVCSQSITVNDLFAPEIDCGDTLTFNMEMDSCETSLTIPLDISIIENCKLSQVYNETLPASTEGSFIIFEYDTITGIHLATNRLFVFDNVTKMKFGDRAELNIEINGDINNFGESYQIVGEGGLSLGTTKIIQGSDCNSSILKINIPRNAFNLWADNGRITILAIAPTGNIEGGGINPCTPIQPDMTVDGFSTLKATLLYFDGDVSYKINDDTTTYHVPLGSDSITAVLTQGENIIEYSISDLGGNNASCEKIIEVRDLQNPEAICKDGTVEIHPSGLEVTVIVADSIDNGSFDNCGITSYIVIGDTLNCSDVGTNVIVQLIVEDNGGNRDSCLANVTVGSYTIMPSFTAGICEGDTLKLFSNLPAGPSGASYTFEWYKDDTLFSTLENPIIPDASNQLNGIYKVIATGFNGCLSEGSLDVNIVPLTKPEIITSQASICIGDDVVLTSTNFGGNVVYSWYEGSFPNGTLVGTSASGSFAVSPTITNHTYYIIANNTDCETPPSDSLKIEVYAKPIPTVANSFITVCNGELINLEATNSNIEYSYEWIGPDNFTSSSKSPTAFTANNDKQGDYKLVVSIGDCQSDTSIVSVTTLPRPTTPILSGEMIYCKGSTFSLLVSNVTNGTTYMWYKNGLLFRTTQDNSLDIPNAQTDLTGDWTVVVVRDGCMSIASAILPITVDDLINVGADNSGPVCAGDSVFLNATFVPNATYQWSGPNFTGIGQNIKAPSVAGDYSVTITTPTNCSNVATTEVIVNTPPSITALSSNNPNCIDENTVISFSPTVFPNGQFTYSWTGPNGFTSDILNPSIDNLSFTDTGRYTLVVFSDQCPSVPSSINIRFGISPNRPTISGPLELCQGDVLNINTSETAETYSWITPSGTFANSTNSYTIPSVAGLNNGEYKLVLFNGICGSDTSNILNINIKPVPIAPQIIGENDICFGEEIILSTNIIGAQEYSWTLPDNTVSTNDSIIIENVSAQNEGTYQLTYRIDGCLSFTSEMFFINIKDSIPTPAFLDKTLSLCSDLNEAIEICLDPNTLSAGTTYELVNLANSSVIATTTGLCFTISDPSLLSSGSNELAVVGKRDGCQSRTSESVFVIFQSPPSVIANAIDNLIIACQGDDFVSLESNNGPPEVDILWTALTPGVIISNPNNKTTLATGFLQGENLIKLSYSKDGCNDFSNDTVRVFLEPRPVVNDDNFNLDINAPTTINFQANDQLPINSTTSILETFLNGTLTVNNGVYTYAPPIGYVGVTTFTYEVCIDDCPDLCEAATVTLNVGQDTDCILPTIMTPNNDGINDKLLIPCIDSDRFNTNRIFVFNEWGDEVFYAKPYDNNWDGTYGGEPLPVGTYFIVFEPGNGASPIRGFLTLQR